MNENKNTNANSDFQSTETTARFNSTALNLNIYKELDENPNQHLDLVSHIKNQLQQLNQIHKRKMFMIKEISSLRSR